MPRTPAKPTTTKTQGKVTRGMVTARTGQEGRSVAPPVILPRREPAPLPERQRYTFVTNGARFYHVKVATLRGEDRAALREKEASDKASEDEALTRAALGDLPDDYVVFNDYTFNTESLAVAKWIEDRVRRGTLLGVARDSAQMKVRCAYTDEDGDACTYWVFNTKQGLDDMARHILEDHDSYEDDTWLDAIPSNSPNDPFLPPLDDDEDATAGQAEGDDAP